MKTEKDTVVNESTINPKEGKSIGSTQIVEDIYNRSWEQFKDNTKSATAYLTGQHEGFSAGYNRGHDDATRQYAKSTVILVTCAAVLTGIAIGACVVAIGGSKR